MKLLWWNVMLIGGLWGALAVAQDSNEYTPPSSNPEYLYPFGDHVYFSAEDGIHGRELWRVDHSGNAELVKDITPGPAGTRIDQFRAFKGALYFRAEPAGDIPSLWRTDGTAGGTEQVLDPSLQSSVGGLAYISAASEHYLYLGWGQAGGATRIGYSDGTPSGTQYLTAEVEPILMVDHPACAVSKDQFVFAARSRVDGNEVYVFNERSRETVRLLRTESEAGDFVALEDGSVHFSADDGERGMEYWITNGTPDSTRLLADIYPGPESSNPSQRILFGQNEGVSTVFFAATHPETGRELWVTDGTPEGTRLFADLIPGSGSSNPGMFKAISVSLYFVATGDGAGRELWGYMAGQEAPKMLADLYPGPQGSDPYAMCTAGSQYLVFSALTPSHGEELWICRDANSAPELAQDIMPGPASSFPYYTCNLDSAVITVATSPVAGRELHLVKPLNGEVTLFADIYTDRSVNPSSHPQQLTPVGDLLFFVANDIAHGNELWCTDGTSDGTRLVKDILPGRASSNPEELTAVEDLLYFTADDGVHGPELWRSDGTEAGTGLVLDIEHGSGATVRNLTRFGRHLIFSAYEPRVGEELWILEYGKQPRLLKDIAAGPASSNPGDFVVWKDCVYFQADDGVHGRELWRTDGTEAGTELVRDIVGAPFEAAAFGEVSLLDGNLYIAADIDGAGMELWKIREDRGTLELLRDIAGPAELGALRATPAD